MAAQVSAARAEHQITGVGIAGGVNHLPPRGNGAALIDHRVIERARVLRAADKALKRIRGGSGDERHQLSNPITRRTSSGAGLPRCSITSFIRCKK